MANEHTFVAGSVSLTAAVTDDGIVHFGDWVLPGYTPLLWASPEAYTTAMLADTETVLQECLAWGERMAREERGDGA